MTQPSLTTFEITYNDVVEPVDTIDADIQIEMLNLCDALFAKDATTESMQQDAQLFHNCVQNHNDDEGVKDLYKTITQIIIKKHDVAADKTGTKVGHDQKVSFNISNEEVIADTVKRGKKLPTDLDIFANVGQEHVDFLGTLESSNVPVAFSFNLWRDANDAPLGTYYRDMRTFTSAYGIRDSLQDGNGAERFKPNYKFTDGPAAQQSKKGEIIPVVAMPHRAPLAKDLNKAIEQYGVKARYNVIVRVQYPEVFTVTEQGNPKNSRSNLRF